jgi:hypothetical protein
MLHAPEGMVPADWATHLDDDAQQSYPFVMLFVKNEAQFYFAKNSMRYAPALPMMRYSGCATRKKRAGYRLMSTATSCSAWRMRFLNLPLWPTWRLMRPGPHYGFVINQRSIDGNDSAADFR